MTFRTYAARETAIEQARALGIKPEHLSRMARRSARVTHPEGNRRFEDWVLMVEGDVILSVAAYEPGGATGVKYLSNER